jgi:hypothetical protein
MILPTKGMDMTYLRCSLNVALVLASLAGCAGRGRDWPTLMTAEEQRTGKPASAAQTSPTAPAGTPAGVAVVATPKPPGTANSAFVRAQISRLAEAQRDAAYIQERWTKQHLALTVIAAGVQSKGPGDTQWNKAQLELTKLNQIAAEWDDLETLVNKVTGQLAIRAHQGEDVITVLADSGALLAQIETARAEAARAREVLRRKISL